MVRQNLRELLAFDFDFSILIFLFSDRRVPSEFEQKWKVEVGSKQREQHYLGTTSRIIAQIKDLATKCNASSIIVFQDTLARSLGKGRSITYELLGPIANIADDSQEELKKLVYSAFNDAADSHARLVSEKSDTRYNSKINGVTDEYQQLLLILDKAKDAAKVSQEEYTQRKANLADKFVESLKGQTTLVDLAQDIVGDLLSDDDENDDGEEDEELMEIE